MVTTKTGVVYEISYEMRARGKTIDSDDESIVVGAFESIVSGRYRILFSNGILSFPSLLQSSMARNSFKRDNMLTRLENGRPTRFWW